MQGEQVPSLVGELRYHMLCGVSKNKRETKSMEAPQDGMVLWNRIREGRSFILPHAIELLI